MNKNLNEVALNLKDEISKVGMQASLIQDINSLIWQLRSSFESVEGSRDSREIAFHDHYLQVRVLSELLLNSARDLTEYHRNVRATLETLLDNLNEKDVVQMAELKQELAREVIENVIG